LDLDDLFYTGIKVRQFLIPTDLEPAKVYVQRRCIWQFINSGNAGKLKKKEKKLWLYFGLS
jgi:hypothetical protein